MARTWLDDCVGTWPAVSIQTPSAAQVRGGSGKDYCRPLVLVHIDPLRNSLPHIVVVVFSPSFVLGYSSMLSTHLVNGCSGNELWPSEMLKPYPRYVPTSRLRLCLCYGPVNISGFKLEWQTFFLGSSVQSVLFLSDFDPESSVFSDKSYGFGFDRTGVIMTFYSHNPGL